MMIVKCTQDVNKRISHVNAFKPFLLLPENVNNVFHMCNVCIRLKCRSIEADEDEQDPNRIGNIEIRIFQFDTEKIGRIPFTQCGSKCENETEVDSCDMTQ